VSVLQRCHIRFFSFFVFFAGMMCTLFYVVRAICLWLRRDLILSMSMRPLLEAFSPLICWMLEKDPLLNQRCGVWAIRGMTVDGYLPVLRPIRLQRSKTRHHPFVSISDLRQTVPVEFGSCGLGPGPERELIQNSYPDKTRDAYGIKLNEFHVNSTEFQFNS
jgi:hypothetical protein